MGSKRETSAARVALAVTAVLAPVALIVGFTILAEFSSNLAGGGLGAAPLYAAELLVGAVVIFVFLRWIAALRGTRPPVLGGSRGMVYGAAVGLAASLGSALLFYAWKRPTLASPLAPVLRPSRVISNAGVAAIEEAGFRAGVVHIATAAWGQLAGLLAGSIPFGVLHLLGFIFGRPPSLTHVISVSAAGWLLSLLYLQFGLTSAFACHWVWNSLASNLARAFQLPRRTGVMMFEGAWTTVLVLVILCVVIHRLARSSTAPVHQTEAN
jgi:membrane protease YdiL (CAAX protease family)